MKIGHEAVFPSNFEIFSIFPKFPPTLQMLGYYATRGANRLKYLILSSILLVAD